MPINLTVNGTTYAYPVTGTDEWGDQATLWAQAVTAGMLQKAGGSFTLTAETDFGASYGLKSVYYKSRATNPASAGQIRLGNNESIAWRNSTDTADIALKVDSSDKLNFGGSAVSAAEFGYLSGVTSSIQTQITGKMASPMTANGDLIIQSGGAPAKLGIGTTNQVLTVSAGLPSWKTYTGPTGAFIQTTDTLSGDATVSSTSWADTPLAVSVTTTKSNEIVLLSLCGTSSSASGSIVVGYRIDAGSDYGLTSIWSLGNMINISYTTILSIATPGTYTITVRAYKIVGSGDFTITGNATYGYATMTTLQV